MLLHSEKQKKYMPVIEYPHTNGKLDGLITEIYVARDWIIPIDENKSHHALTEKGFHHLSELGVDPSVLETKGIHVQQE